MSVKDALNGVYEAFAAEIGRLVDTKQKAYGDSFGRSGGIVAILYPGGISAGQMDDALTIIRIIDKLFRIATDRDALGESPWRDIAGYAILAALRVERRKAAEKVEADRLKAAEAQKLVDPLYNEPVVPRQLIPLTGPDAPPDR
jgi:hypothetical protein